MVYNNYPAIRVPVLDPHGQEVPEYGIQCEFLTPCLTRSQARVRRQMQSEYENSKIVSMARKKRQRQREERVEIIYSVLTLVLIGASLFLLTLLG